MCGILLLRYEVKEEEEVKVESVPMVCKFPDVFSKELLGLPLQRGIDFEIELIQSTQSICKTLY